MTIYRTTYVREERAMCIDEYLLRDINEMIYNHAKEPFELTLEELETIIKEEVECDHTQGSRALEEFTRGRWGDKIRLGQFVMDYLNEWFWEVDAYDYETTEEYDEVR